MNISIDARKLFECQDCNLYARFRKKDSKRYLKCGCGVYDITKSKSKDFSDGKLLKADEVPQEIAELRNLP